MFCCSGASPATYRSTFTGEPNGENGSPAGTSRLTPGRPCSELLVAPRVALKVALIPAKIGRAITALAVSVWVAGARL
jgi:hypothetical protein